MQNEEEIKNNIKHEIEKCWLQVFSDMHRPPLSRDDFGEILLESEAEARDITTNRLQPHLAIFELGLEFLSYVHIALSPLDRSKPINNHTRVVWVLTGAAVSFGVSIRSLAISGLDTPARALLRTYVETLFLCIAVLHDRTLGEAYFAADTDEEVKNFWHSKASPKKLHKKIIEIENQIGINKDVIEKFTEWRRREYEVLSQSSHLSYLASAMTTMHHKLGEKDELGSSIFGLASTHSFRTLFYAAATSWHFSRLSNPVLLGKKTDEFAIVLDKENEWHQRIVAARDTLSDVMMRHWDTRSATSNYTDSGAET